MTFDRLNCLIPSCRRTHLNREGYASWICAKHWSMVPKAQRREMASLRRRGQEQARNVMWNASCDEVIARCLSGDDLLG